MLCINKRLYWSNGSDRPQRSDRPNGSDGSQRSDRSNGSDRPQWSNGSDGSQWSNRPNGSDRSQWSNRPNGSDRPQWSNRPNGSNRSDRARGRYGSDRYICHSAGRNSYHWRAWNLCRCSKQRDGAGCGAGIYNSQRRYWGVQRIAAITSGIFYACPGRNFRETASV